MGLAARVLEAAGITTIVHSWIPALSACVGAPRVVGIGFPGALPFGDVGDAEGQRAVLRASLESGLALQRGAQRVDLPFEWPASKRVPKPPALPPIARAIVKRPWLYMRLRDGRLPDR